MTGVLQGLGSATAAVQGCRTAGVALRERRSAAVAVPGRRAVTTAVREQQAAAVVQRRPTTPPGLRERRSASAAVRGCLRAVALALALALSAASAASAQPPLPLARVASVPVSGPVTALAAGDGLVVAAVGPSVYVVGVVGIDPLNLSWRIIGRRDFERPVLGVAVNALLADGPQAYVANSHDGLRRLDLSNPSAPALTGTAFSRGQVVGVAASGFPGGGYVFAADNAIGFDIVEGTGAFARVGEYLADGFPRSIAAVGSLVFVADQPAGLIVVDASDPAAPRVVGRLSLGRDPVVQVFASPGRDQDFGAPPFVCIVSGRGGLQVVDVSDPSAPRVAAAVPTFGPPTGAALWGRRLYVASGGLIEEYDLADRARPRRIAAAAVGATTGAVAVNWEHVFVASGSEIVVHRREPPPW